MTTCRCHPSSRCGRCDQATTLAAELAANNRRCGHTEDGWICLRQAKHKGEHQFEAVACVIPF